MSIESKTHQKCATYVLVVAFFCVSLSVHHLAAVQNKYTPLESDVETNVRSTRMMTEDGKSYHRVEVEPRFEMDMYHHSTPMEEKLIESVIEKEEKVIPSMHYMLGSYGGKKFTPPDVVGITSFNHKRENYIAQNLPDLKPELAEQTAQSLDFVVAGFAKTGTTFLTQWLNNESISMLQREQCQFAACSGYSQGKVLPDRKPITLINRLIHDRQELQGKKLSFKCPNLVEDDIVDEVFSTYFPNTDFIIGLRHPVKWFNSFYNYRLLKNLSPAPLVNELIGSKCEYGLRWKVCTDRAKYALPLAKFGKTEMSPEEVETLVDMVREDDDHYEHKRDSIQKFFEHQNKPSMGRIFIYDLDQLADTDQSHLETFAADLTEFLKIDTPLTIPTRDNRKLKKKPVPEGYLHYTGEWGEHEKWDEFERPRNEKEEARHRHELLKIDICDPLYDKVRQELVKEGKQTADWLINYFLQSPDVVVSQRDRLEELIAGYGIDPCKENL